MTTILQKYAPTSFEKNKDDYNSTQRNVFWNKKRFKVLAVCP